MDSDHIDTIDDPGRKESERRLQNKMSSKYLDEIIEKTGMEYEEAVEAIEREKKARDAMADGTTDMYGADLGTKIVDWYARNTHTMPVYPQIGTIERQDFVKGREEDKERVKDLLGAGKRVSEGETGVKQGGKLRQVLTVEIANESFDDVKPARDVELEKRMKQMQKGVKKMCKEMDQ